VSGLAGRAGSGIGRMVPRGPQVLGAARSRLAAVGRSACPNSFSATTLVATASGAVAIGSLVAGEHVLGYDEATGTVGSYPISVVHINADPVTGVVVIDGEPVETTPEHPFYTVEVGWLDAEDLVPGLHVPSADGTNGVVEAISWTAGPATMYNLTVEEAHTFFVGEGAWLVHNDGCGPLPGTGPYRPTGGHHPHAKAAFEKPYDPNKALTISDRALDRASGQSGTHARIGPEQQRMFIELARSGRPNTLREHTNIAWRSMVAVGIPRRLARDWTAASLRSIRAMGVRAPARIPWGARYAGTKKQAQ